MKDNQEFIEEELGEKDLFSADAIISAIKEDDSKSIKRYLDKNIFNDFLDEDENTPIHIAVLKKNRKSLLLFLEHGINPNQVNSKHLTPLHIALNQKDIKSAKLLLKFGADKDILDNNGKNAIELAEEMQLSDFIVLANKFSKNIQSDVITSANYDSCVNALTASLNDIINPKKRINTTFKAISQFLNIEEEIIQESNLNDNQQYVSMLSGIFSGIKKADKLSSEEKLKLVRKYISSINSILLPVLSAKNRIEEIQKLSKLEKISEDKIIYFTSETESDKQTFSNPKEEKEIQVTLAPETLKNILEKKCKEASTLSPYNFLDYDNQQIICRQINKEMCFIDKITIKTHSPINGHESEAILNSCEKDIKKEDVKKAKNSIKGKETILLLSDSKNFDSHIRPGKTNNMHLVYFCPHGDSYENNLDKLSRISLSTGCTVHSFNYPGINHSTGHVDESKDMIYAGLATVNLLLEKGISLDKIILFSDSESYSTIKNVVRQFLLEDLKVNRFGIIDLSLEHNKRKFKPSNLRKSLLYYNPNKVDLALYTAANKEEKLAQSLNESVFYEAEPKLFEKSAKCPSVISQLKKYIQVNQECLKQNQELLNPELPSFKIDTIKGEIQL